MSSRTPVPGGSSAVTSRTRPGSKLPTERALVEQLSAPRSAVRRALENLEHEG